MPRTTYALSLEKVAVVACRKEESKDYYYNRGGKEKAADRYKHMKRTYILRNRYGITEDDYKTLFKKQEGCCAICGADYSTSERNLDVDHDHNTGIVRGLLCNNCNRGLGHMQDDIKILENAVRYLNGK